MLPADEKREVRQVQPAKYTSPVHVTKVTKLFQSAHFSSLRFYASITYLAQLTFLIPSSKESELNPDLPAFLFRKQ